MKRLTVTQTDITLALNARLKGTSLAKYTCPIAQALKRRFPKYIGISVMGAIRYIPVPCEGAHRYRIDYTPRIKRFIGEFDAKWAVQPTTFRLPEAIKES